MVIEMESATTMENHLNILYNGIQTSLVEHNAAQHQAELALLNMLKEFKQICDFLRPFRDYFGSLDISEVMKYKALSEQLSELHERLGKVEEIIGRNMYISGNGQDSYAPQCQKNKFFSGRQESGPAVTDNQRPRCYNAESCSKEHLILDVNENLDREMQVENFAQNETGLLPPDEAVPVVKIRIPSSALKRKLEASGLTSEKTVSSSRIKTKKRKKSRFISESLAKQMPAKDSSEVVPPLKLHPVSPPSAFYSAEEAGSVYGTNRVSPGMIIEQDKAVKPMASSLSEPDLLKKEMNRWKEIARRTKRVTSLTDSLNSKREAYAKFQKILEECEKKSERITSLTDGKVDPNITEGHTQAVKDARSSVDELRAAVERGEHSLTTETKILASKEKQLRRALKNGRFLTAEAKQVSLAAEAIRTSDSSMGSFLLEAEIREDNPSVPAECARSMSLQDPLNVSQAHSQVMGNCRMTDSSGSATMIGHSVPLFPAETGILKLTGCAECSVTPSVCTHKNKSPVNTSAVSPENISRSNSQVEKEEELLEVRRQILDRLDRLQRFKHGLSSVEGNLAKLSEDEEKCNKELADTMNGQSDPLQSAVIFARLKQILAAKCKQKNKIDGRRREIVESESALKQLRKKDRFLAEALISVSPPQSGGLRRGDPAQPKHITVSQTNHTRKETTWSKGKGVEAPLSSWLAEGEIPD